MKMWTRKYTAQKKMVINPNAETSRMKAEYHREKNREPGGNLLLLMGRADWRANVSKLEQEK